MKLFKFTKEKIVIVLVVGLLVRIALSFFGTLQLDFNTFLAWSNRLAEVGFKDFYKVWSDYLPGYLYVLWFLGKLNPPAYLQTLIYKLPAILADLGTGYLIYKIVGGTKREKLALALSLFYVLNPAVLANSTLWGQVDSITSFLGMLTVYLATRGFLASALTLAIGTAVKPQMSLVAIVVVYIFIRERWKIQKILLYIAVSFIVFCLCFLPFTNLTELPAFLMQRMQVTLGQYPYSSVNAFSFWGLFGFWKKDMVGIFPPWLIGYVVVGLVALISFFKLRKTKNGEYVLLAVLYILSFLFFTRMHERHLLPALAPLLIAASVWGEFIFVYIFLSFTYLANLYYSFIWITKNFTTVFSQGLIDVLILVNLAMLGYSLFIFIRNKARKVNWLEDWLTKLGSKFLAPDKEAATLFPKLNFPERKTKYILGVIIVFALVTRVAWLWAPPSEYFDEVYHAFTAKLVLHFNPKAWEWWNPNPEGYAYEWTHPPVAKLGMALGMKIMGESAFGWRLPGAILGTVCVWLVYKIAKEFFDDKPLALISAALFSLDGLVLTMSRIGMNDIYLLCFILASIYCFMKKKDFLSAIFFGLAVSSKWSAIWAMPILGVLFLVIRRKFSKSLIWFFILPIAVYILSYFQMFLTGHGFDILVGVQKQMWWYHTNLKATHLYTSSWWSWPLDIRPVYLYTSEEVAGWVARIYNLGNPVIFWFGLFAVFTSFIYSFYDKNKKLAVVIFSYFIFFVPWAASPRIMFFYHYLPSLPFLAIASGYFLRRNPKIIIPFLVLSFLVFVYFYPHWAGLKIPLWLDTSYYWFASWR